MPPTLLASAPAVPAPAIARSILARGAPPARDNGFSLPDHWVWDPSVIRAEDGRYHMFASRWPKWLPFHPGWGLHSEIVRAVSDTPEGPYEFQEVVLPARGAEYFDGRATHNPRILRQTDGTYLLFYMGSTNPFPDIRPGQPLLADGPEFTVARANKRIGLATAPSVTGPWTRLDHSIFPTKPGSFYSFLTSNPSPCLDPDGGVTIVFKSRRYLGNTHGPMELGIARAPAPAGPYRVLMDHPLELPGGEVEDPFFWRSRRGYEMIAKDMHGGIGGEKYGGVHAWSPDGRSWRWGTPAAAYSRTLTFDDGLTETLGCFERVSLLFDGDRPTHLFGAVADGPGGFCAATRTWNMCVPLAGAE
jgi:hypothetical protein